MDQVKLAMEREINRIELAIINLQESLERNIKDYNVYYGESL